jgi:hypothetical protein
LAYALLAAAFFGFLVLGLLAVVVRRGSGVPESGPRIAAPSRALTYGGAFIALATIGIFYRSCLNYAAYSSVPTRLILACGIVPLAVVLCDEILRRWPEPAERRRARVQPLPLVWLVVILGVVPVSAVALVSLAVPLLAPRTVYSYGPYTLVLVCAGILSLSARWLVRLPLLGALLAVNVVGLLHERPSPIDYVGLARQLAPEDKPQDLWFVRRHYFMTPLFYHLRPHDNRLIGAEYAAVLEHNPGARVWVLGLEGLETPPEMLEPLRHYRRAGRFERRGIYADLYVPAGAVADSSGSAALKDE